MAVPPAGGAKLGPSPSTKMRKLLTPTVLVALAVGGSAKPLPTGIVPPTLVPTAPLVSPEQTSKAPAQSAKLMIIDGVPEVKTAGAGNRPSVNCSKLTGPATKERETAA